MGGVIYRRARKHRPELEGYEEMAEDGITAREFEERLTANSVDKLLSQRRIDSLPVNALIDASEIERHERVGAGGNGVVYRGEWRGTAVGE